MEAIRASETLTNFYQTIRHHTSKDSNRRGHGRENLKSHTKRTASHISDSPATGWPINASLYLPPCSEFTARAGCVTPRGKVVLPQQPVKKLTWEGGQGKRNWSLLWRHVRTIQYAPHLPWTVLVYVITITDWKATLLVGPGQRENRNWLLRVIQAFFMRVFLVPYVQIVSHRLSSNTFFTRIW
jgi:hypothetical protein